ncbi:hypothetical protein [Beijerinckia indica]|uniref:Uncharacterized protein n=1 Tax=Beijerinckia indica subsp. indica (strain ATCC 9039 / DSM 1715 / NCIMB 8712) TaxID=395963 RepID=B2IIU9_BEII9|nr:hypothetical protein [Beijerinckia indica]ACB96161.1 hypothetical protein Bind_2559 [Beijerinckia indica subsp. indica ATCC 9039]
MNYPRSILLVSSLFIATAAPQIATAQEHYDALAVRAAELGGKIFIRSPRSDSGEFIVDGRHSSNTDAVSEGRSAHSATRQGRERADAARERALRYFAHVDDYSSVYDKWSQ